MEFETTTNAGHASVRWADAATGVANGRILLSAFRRIGLQVQRTMMHKASNDLLDVRSGNLRRAIFYRIEQFGRDLLVRIGVDLTKAKYGRIQNAGGVIRPKNSQFLTIPVGVNLTGNGVMKVGAREFISNPGSLGFTGSFVNPAKTAIMGRRADGGIEPVFALRRSVTIRPTGYITRSLTDNLDYVKQQVKGAALELSEEITRGRS